MNIVLRKPDNPNDDWTEYLIVFVMESIKGGYVCGAKRIGDYNDGELIEQCQQFGPMTLKEARDRCMARAKVKVRKRGYKNVHLDEIPYFLSKWLIAPPGITAEDLLAEAKEAKTERYVVFSDVTGIEEFFDIGVEYIGYDTGEGYLVVYDRCGVRRECFSERMSSIVPTERSIQISEVFLG